MKINIKKVLQNELEQHGYKVANGTQEGYCPHVNGLTTYCLAQMGETSLAREVMDRYLQSVAFDSKRSLFYKMVSESKILDPTINACKNAIAALGLNSIGKQDEAKSVLNALQESPLLTQDGLLYREYDTTINKHVYVQTNLWYALALSSVGEEDNAKTVLSQLEKYENSSGLLVSEDAACEGVEPPKTFLDDQSLYIMSLVTLGENQRAVKHVELVLESDYFDERTGLYQSYPGSQTFSTYKNSLFAIALTQTGFTKEASRLCNSLEEKLSNGKYMQETMDKNVFVADNNALYSLAKYLATE